MEDVCEIDITPKAPTEIIDVPPENKETTMIVTAEEVIKQNETTAMENNTTTNQPTTQPTADDINRLLKNGEIKITVESESVWRTAGKAAVAAIVSGGVAYGTVRLLQWLFEGGDAE